MRHKFGGHTFFMCLPGREKRGGNSAKNNKPVIFNIILVNTKNPVTFLARVGEIFIDQ